MLIGCCWRFRVTPTHRGVSNSQTTHHGVSNSQTTHHGVSNSQTTHHGVSNNQTASSKPDSLLDEFTKASESRINDSMSNTASQPPAQWVYKYINK